MGPGARHDMLDDHWGFWNWQKLVGLGQPGVLLFNRLQLAIEWRDKNEELHQAYSLNQTSHIDEWKKMVEEFDKDRMKPNPYELPESDITLQQVRRELAEEELQAFPSTLAPKKAAELLSKGPSSFIILALEVEEQQRQLQQDVALKSKGSRMKQTSEIVDKCLRLHKLLARFKLQQSHFMPIMQQLLACSSSNLADIELCLRNAQCSESLDNIRNLLLIKSRLLTYKEGQVRHQEQLQQMSQLLGQNEYKICLHVARYQTAWAAYERLQNGIVPWRKLNESDIRCMGDPEDRAVKNPRKKLGKKSHATGKVQAQQEVAQSSDDEGNMGDNSHRDLSKKQWDQKRDRMVKKTGEGFQEISWIWQAADQKGYASDEALYNEWAKSYARLRCWQEEVMLVEEEMR
ncbi:hypothetical protein VNI00_017139 [Paramarasmius palmivorus]|uniref:Uncharacterized protein n=1 Tax=Paramarasmius palmivorus TaxID=297713 RepID=A0AAW0B6Z5_9AGAR